MKMKANFLQALYPIVDSSVGFHSTFPSQSVTHTFTYTQKEQGLYFMKYVAYSLTSQMYKEEKSYIMNLTCSCWIVSNFH